MPGKDLIAKLKKDAVERTDLLERCLKRLEWEKQREAEDKAAADKAEAERIAMQSIDWYVHHYPSPNPFSLFICPSSTNCCRTFYGAVHYAANSLFGCNVAVARNGLAYRVMAGQFACHKNPSIAFCPDFSWNRYEAEAAHTHHDSSDSLYD